MPFQLHKNVQRLDSANLEIFRRSSAPNHWKKTLRVCQRVTRNFCFILYAMSLGNRCDSSTAMLDLDLTTLFTSKPVRLQLRMQNGYQFLAVHAGFLYSADWRPKIDEDTYSKHKLGCTAFATFTGRRYNNVNQGVHRQKGNNWIYATKSSVNSSRNTGSSPWNFPRLAMRYRTPAVACTQVSCIFTTFKWL